MKTEHRTAFRARLVTGFFEKWATGVKCGLSLSLVFVLAPRVVLQVLKFSLPPQYSIFQFDLKTEDKKSHLTECPLPIDKSSLV